MEIRVSDDPSSDAAAWIARRLRRSIRDRGRGSIALSGGSTTPPMIADLVALGLPWEQIDVWQVDERVAPDGDLARNAGQLGVIPASVHLMPVTSADLRAAARRYASGLPDQFDVVHLGIGEDGHTASWPPGNSDVMSSDRQVELVPAFHGVPRMTLTPRVVNSARARVVLATGAAKAPVVAGWLLADRTLPITHVRRTATVLCVDRAAAPDQPVTR